MAKRTEISSALGSGKEIQCIMLPEELHAWTLKSPWKKESFASHKVQLVAIEVKASKSTGESSKHEISKKTPLILKSGVEIFNGLVGTTTQNRTARFYFRVDNINEFNTAMKELSLQYDFSVWDVTKAEIYNPNLAATLYYEMHNPNGVGARLYLKSAKTPEYDKPYEAIDIFEQQRISNNFYDIFASCKIGQETKEVKTCALMHRNSLKN